jgi:hypothetical protein
LTSNTARRGNVNSDLSKAAALEGSSWTSLLMGACLLLTRQVEIEDDEKELEVELKW